MLLDPDSLDLVDRVETVLEASHSGECAGQVSCELFQSEVEVHTPVCADVPQVARELQRLRDHVGREAAAAGVRVAAAGTHPFALFETQHVTQRPRYVELIEQLQYPARRELIFGLHVHVGMPSPEVAIRAHDRLRPYLAELTALSASSPFWRGTDTGLASVRHAVFATFPRSGLPPRFDDYEQFELVVSAFESAGYVDDYTYLWWDLRPHPRLGTLEVRVMDTVPRIDEALALVAYVQALAKHVVEDGDGAAPHDELIRESKWQAMRRGLEARVFTPHGFAPVRDAVARTLERIAPHAEELGGAAYLTGIERILARGNSADRQRAAFASGKGVVAVAAELVAETATRASEPSLAGS